MNDDVDELIQAIQALTPPHASLGTATLPYQLAVVAATTPKADFHANRCPHAKSDGTLHLDARRGGFVGAIDWATKRQH